MATATLPFPLSAPRPRKETDRQAGGWPPPPNPPPGAPQGAAGDSSPSELSYVSFLLRWGLGVNQFLGVVSPGPAVFSSGLGWGWSGARTGQGESKHTGMLSPSYKLSGLPGVSFKLESVRVSCLHYPLSFSPSALERAHFPHL